MVKPINKEENKIVCEIILNDLKYLSAGFYFLTGFFTTGAETANQLLDNIIKLYLKSIPWIKLMSYLNTIGLACNFAGTLLVAFYISKDPNEWVESEDRMKPGEKRYALLIKHPCFLKVGIFLIVVGFLLSLIDSLLK
ncbi:hypothetical protein KJ695_01440 [Patescibacteria group bacterium]|nr:hypothetical protein [Patescibacteria group bacterium]MBU4056556.1 hypothetical protein [Patescibacteria group bacterium]MBU4368515.1 hypothetical protein [Patescibacteria group bacterium]